MIMDSVRDPVSDDPPAMKKGRIAATPSVIHNYGPDRVTLVVETKTAA